MEQIVKQLSARADVSYADFIARLTPSVSPTCILGVRMPELRKLAKTLSNDRIAPGFLETLPHTYYEENILHVLLIDQMCRQYADAIQRTETFLPYIDNWAVCDTLRPRVFDKNRGPLSARVSVWLNSSQTYTVRFGAVMLMRHFLQKDFSPSLLQQAMTVRTEEYYVNMALAWLLCEALIHQYDNALPYLTEGSLPVWMHNKAIQKSVESYRLSVEQKTFLRSLRR